MNDLFISHVQEDHGIALEVARGVESAGFTTWYYERDSDGGPSYLVQTREAVVSSQAVLLIVSRDSVGSAQVSREIVRAHESNKPIVPLLHGISDAEYKRRQPEWEEAIGAATSLEIPDGSVDIILPRVLRGLQKMGIQPKASSAATQKNGSGTSVPAGLASATTLPTAGTKQLYPRILICAILSTVGLAACMYNMIETAHPSGQAALFYQGFLVVRPINFAINAFNFLNNALLLAGAWMCFQAIASGFKMVRAVTLVILPGIALWTVAVLLAMVTASAWEYLSPGDKDAVIMNTFLMAFLGTAPTCLILFLFRKGR
jgi:hypothetical protein